MNVQQIEDRRQVVMRRLVAKIRRCIGKGKTIATRGCYDMYFARGIDAYEAAFEQLNIRFGFTQKRNNYWVFVDKKTGRDIELKSFESGTNNVVTVSYM